MALPFSSQCQFVLAGKWLMRPLRGWCLRCVVSYLLAIFTLQPIGWAYSCEMDSYISGGIEELGLFCTSGIFSDNNDNYPHLYLRLQPLIRLSLKGSLALWSLCLVGHKCLFGHTAIYYRPTAHSMFALKQTSKRRPISTADPPGALLLIQPDKYWVVCVWQLVFFKAATSDDDWNSPWNTTQTDDTLSLFTMTLVSHAICNILLSIKQLGKIAFSSCDAHVPPWLCVSWASES